VTAGKSIGLPPLLQRPPIPITARLGVRSWITLLLVRPAWLWRREIAAVLTLAASAGLGGWGLALIGSASHAAGWACWIGVALAPVLLVLVWASLPQTRAAGARWRYRARLGRRWDAACRYAGLATHNDRIPRILRVWRVPAGDLVKARMPKGSIVADLAEAREHLAACLRVRDVRVARDTERAHLAHVEIVRTDPFLPEGRPVSLVWPWADREAVRLWEPVPVGVDEMGQTVTLELPERGVLAGGEPGSGKSVAVSQLLAAAALDPWCRIWGLDAKQLELALWEPVLERVAYNDIDQAIDLVGDLVEEMDATYGELKRLGLRKIPHGSPLIVLAVDELRFYTAHTTRKKAAEFNGLLIDLEARGRAAGIIPVKATQKPSADVVPTSLRDLSAIRWAMRSTTRDASDTILGAGWATAGYSSADIDAQTPGVGWLLSEGGFPILVKSYYLSDDDIRAIAARGAALREALRQPQHDRPL
jgi:hypothetical protein